MGWEDNLISAPQANPADVPAWQRSLLPTGLPKDFEPAPQGQRTANGIFDAMQAGYQGSATGLVLRSKLPDVVLDHAHSKWYERAAAGATQFGAEFLPFMVPGAIAGGAVGTATGAAAGSVVPGIGTAAGGVAGGLVGTGAGSFAVPALVREAYTQALMKGEITSTADFLTRAQIVLKATGKEALIGGLTFGAGGAVGRVVGKTVAPMVGETLSGQAASRVIGTASTGAELGTMVVAPAVLEGRMPEPQDFLDAAIVLGGMKGAAHVAGRLANVYAKTGKTPEEVLADATRDPTIKEDLMKTEPPRIEQPGIVQTIEHVRAETETGVPRAYEGIAAAETAHNVVPDIAIDDLKIGQVLAKPLGDVPVDKQPNFLNMRYVEGPDGVREASARISEVFGQQIEEARGKESWEQTRAKAAELIRRSGVDPETLDPAKFRDLAANLMAKNAMAQRASYDVFNLAKQIESSGGTDADFAALAKAIEVSALTTATFQGDAASVARAMNAIKAAKQVTELGKGITELQAKYGEDPRLLAKMIGRLKDSNQIAKFAKDAAKATTLEKVIEAWKAAILSGTTTHIANVMGNTTFMLIRPMIDAVSVPIGLLHGGVDRVTAMEPVARLLGNAQGMFDALKFGAAALEAAYAEGGLKGAIRKIAVDEPNATAKAESFRPAIGADADSHAVAKVGGHIIRLPFRALSLADALFKTMNEQGEKYALATRQATAEGINPLTREFRERVAEIAQNPTEDMQKAAEQAGLRYTFNLPLGEVGLKVQALVRATKIGPLVVPFVRTPGNIAKELARMTPFAPFVREWRDALSSKGPERDRAIAELAVGTAAMGAVAMLTMNETITGQGSPDPNKRKVMMSAGWQPYSIKVGDKYYNYQRLQPAGTLIGLAADLAEVWDYLDTDEADKIPKMLSVAFANAVTNQTFLQGITNVVNAGSDPGRYGPRLAQQYAGSLVPGIIAQPMQMSDPVQREVNSMLDAIRARLPGREGMLAKRDTFGEPVATKERLGGLSPITETKVSEDKVRTEAARLGLSISDVPKKIHVGRGSGKLGEVELTPEQKNKFQEVSGKTAHDLLEPIVNSAGWDEMPRLVQERIYKRVFLQAHKVGAIAALPPEERAPVIQHITDRMAIEMGAQ